MSMHNYPLLGYGVRLNKLYYDDKELNGLDIDEILTDDIDSINETTNVNLAVAVDGGGNAYLYFPYCAPWQLNKSEVTLTMEDVQDMMYNVLVKYLTSTYSLDEFKLICEEIQKTYCA